MTTRLYLGTAALLLAAAGLACWGTGSAYSSDGDTTKADRKRDKMISTLYRQLGRLKPHNSGRKDPDDYYLLGTAEVNLATRNADIRFDVKQGQRDVAEYLADYVLSQPQTSVRRWHVFYRLKEAQQAQQALQFTRDQYDRMKSYQAQMQKIYKARCTRRT